MKRFCEQLGVDYVNISAQVARDISYLQKSLANFYTVTPITRGASNRGFCRILIPGSSDPTPFPSSLVLMVLSEPDPHKGIEEVTRLSGELDELPYINVLNHLRSAGVAVPDLYHYNRDAGLLYIEDFGELMLRDAVSGKSDDTKRHYFEAAIRELVKLQVQGSSRDNPRFLGFKIRFDRELLFWELNHFTDYAIRDRMPGMPRPEDEKEIEEHFNRIVDMLLVVPYTLTHRDYQIDNLLVQDEEIKVIDFQDALMGPIPYDLACLLYDRDTADILGDDLIEHLVYYYADQYESESGESISRDEFRGHFDLCVLHRAFKVVGRFYYIHSVKKRDEFLKWIPPMCRAIRTYLMRFPEMEGLQKTLAKYMPEVGVLT
jgi:aminoglycoside/choline kinase family phosphotransferase